MRKAVYCPHLPLAYVLPTSCVTLLSPFWASVIRVYLLSLSAVVHSENLDCSGRRLTT